MVFGFGKKKFQSTNVGLGESRARFLKPNKEELNELRKGDRLRDTPYTNLESTRPAYLRYLKETEKALKKSKKGRSNAKAIRAELKALRIQDKQDAARQSRFNRRLRTEQSLGFSSLPPALQNPEGVGFLNEPRGKRRDPTGLNLLSSDFDLL